MVLGLYWVGQFFWGVQVTSGTQQLSLFVPVTGYARQVCGLLRPKPAGIVSSQGRVVAARTLHPLG